MASSKALLDARNEEILVDEEQPLDKRVAAANYLGNVRNVHSIEKIAKVAVNEKEENSLRSACIEALGKMRSRDGAIELIKPMRGMNEEIRTIGIFRERHPDSDMREPNYGLYVDVINALANLRNSAVPDLFFAMWNSTRIDFTKDLAGILGNIGSKSAVKLLIVCLRTSSNRKVSIAAEDALVNMGERIITPVSIAERGGYVPTQTRERIITRIMERLEGSEGNGKISLAVNVLARPTFIERVTEGNYREAVRTAFAQANARRILRNANSERIQRAKAA